MQSRVPAGLMAMVLNASMQEVAGPVNLVAGLLLLPTVVLAHVMFIYLGKPWTMSTTLRSVSQRVRNLVGRPSRGRVRCHALPLSADLMRAGHGPSPSGGNKDGQGLHPCARWCHEPVCGMICPLGWFVGSAVFRPWPYRAHRPDLNVPVVRSIIMTSFTKHGPPQGGIWKG